jgi:general secretion pathway protein A
MGHRHTLTFYR